MAIVEVCRVTPPTVVVADAVDVAVLEAGAVVSPRPQAASARQATMMKRDRRMAWLLED